MEYNEYLGTLAEIKVMLNTQGNLVVIYNTVDGKEIAEKFSDEDPSSWIYAS